MQEIARSPERTELGSRPLPRTIADLTRRAKELLESTDSRLGISPAGPRGDPASRHRRRGPGVAGRDRRASRGSTASSRRPGGRAWPGRPSPSAHAPTAWNWSSTRPWSKRRSPAGVCCGSRSIRCLLRLGHPIMRQAMATLCRQLHDPTARDADLPLVPGGSAPVRLRGPAGLLLHRHGHQRTAGAAPRRGFLHGLPHRGRPPGARGGRLRADRAGERVPSDQVAGTAGGLGPTAFRGRWFSHRSELEAFLQSQETVAARPCCRPGPTPRCKRETDAAKESYRYRLKELQDRSREQESRSWPRQLVREQAEAMAADALRGDSGRERRTGCRRSRSRWPCCGRTWSGPESC